MCQGQEDQVGKKIGAIKNCPTLEEIEQRKKHEDKLLKINSTEKIEEDACISWRQTGNCDPNGPRELKNDRPCNILISSEASGYCECNGGDTAHSTCQHDPFTCDVECKKLPTLRLAAAKHARDFLENRKREELERIRAETQNSQNPICDQGIEQNTCDQQEQKVKEKIKNENIKSEEKVLLHEEIKARAAMAKSGNGGSRNPYQVLGVSKDAAPKENSKGLSSFKFTVTS